MNTRTNLYAKAQAMMEYILVMVVIVAVVFVAFKKSGGGVLEATQAKTNAYFDTGSKAIMGGYFDGTTFVPVTPNKIDGDWCAWSSCVDGYKARECACPRPAFGGKACDASSPNAQGSGEAVIAADCGGSTCWTSMESSGGGGILLLECNGDNCWCATHPKDPWNSCPSGYTGGQEFTAPKESCRTCSVNLFGNCFRGKGQKWCYKNVPVTHCAGDACVNASGVGGKFDANRNCVVSSSGGSTGGSGTGGGANTSEAND